MFPQKAKLGMKIWPSGLGILVSSTLGTSRDRDKKEFGGQKRKMKGQHKCERMYAQLSPLWKSHSFYLFLQVDQFCLLCQLVALHCCPDNWTLRDHARMLLQSHLDSWQTHCIQYTSAGITSYCLCSRPAYIYKLTNVETLISRMVKPCLRSNTNVEHLHYHLQYCWVIVWQHKKKKKKFTWVPEFLKSNVLTTGGSKHTLGSYQS